MNVKYCQLPGRVTMDNLHRVTRLGQQLLNFFSDKDRAVLASGAAKADGEVALAFAHIMRQKINQQRGDAVDKFLRLRERTDVLSHLRMASRIRAVRGDEMGVRQKANIKRSEEHTSE